MRLPIIKDEEAEVNHSTTSESAIGEEMTSSTVGEMGTTKETASDSDQTPVGDDTDINIQSSEVNKQDEEDHNLAVDTHEQLVLSSSQKSGAKSLHKGNSMRWNWLLTGLTNLNSKKKLITFERKMRNWSINLSISRRK